MNRLRVKIVALYMASLLWVTVFRDVTMTGAKVNLSLFSSYADVLKEEGVFRALWLFFGNIGWFVPWGLLVMPLYTRKYTLKIAAISGFVFSLIIETLQLVMKKGIFELDDLILNTLGAMAGYGLYKLIKLKKRTLNMK